MRYFRVEGNPVPFAYPNDVEAAAVEGKQEIPEEEAMQMAGANRDAPAEERAWRDAELARTDFTQLPDAPVDAAAWSAYREALRAWPDSAEFPDPAHRPVSP